MSDQHIRISDAAARILIWSCVALAMAMPLASTAKAGSMSEARAAYSAGRFVEAARTAEALDTSEGFALAAASLAIHGYFIAGDGEEKAFFERASALARKAVLADPENADAHLQLAHSVGRLAQTVSSLEAANKGYAETIRDAVENALRIDPDLSSAHIILGRWHAEVVSGVGSLLARLTYGARAKDAMASFKRALELAPDAKETPIQIALALLVLDEEKYRETARRLLKRGIALTARDAFERLLHDQAVARLEALDAAGN